MAGENCVTSTSGFGVAMALIALLLILVLILTVAILFLCYSRHAASKKDLSTKDVVQLIPTYDHLDEQS